MIVNIYYLDRHSSPFQMSEMLEICVWLYLLADPSFISEWVMVQNILKTKLSHMS